MTGSLASGRDQPEVGPIRPRVAVVLPYWSFFEASSAVDLRADRAELLHGAVDALSPTCEVVVQTMVEGGDPDRIRHLAGRITEGRVDVLLVVMTMACPPEPVVELIRAVPRVSVVVWACDRAGSLPDPFTHADIVRYGARVGTPMVTSDLVTEGRPFSLVDAAPDSPMAATQIAALVLPAAVAARMRRARIGRLGEAMPGYSSVDDSSERLREGLGVDVVGLPSASLADAMDTRTDAEVTAWHDRSASAYDWHADDPRAKVAAVGLEALMREHGLDAGTLNCHVPDIRGERLGFAPCLALGNATSEGRPWTCTGDVLTTVAMMLGSWLSGTSLYHEIEAYDEVRDDFILANSGEHDLRWAPGPAVVDHNPWWPTGVNARHPLTAGPATLIAVRKGQHGYRLVVAEGDVTPDAVEGTGTAGGRFCFVGPSGRQGWRGWVEAGAGHHSCLSRGHLAAALEIVAAHLRIECVVTTG